MIAPNVILIWTGTNATIPSGFTRETSLDDKFVKGAGAEAVNTTGGAATHTHTATTHGHTLSAHTHAVTMSHNSSPSEASNRADNVIDNHGHVSANIGGISGGSLQNTVVTWASVNHEPPYYKVIYIKATGYKFVPANTIGLLNSATVPTGFATCNGTGTTDLRNKYLKGAGTGADAGTGAGGSTHSHTVTHGHTANSHTHSGTSGQPDTTARRGDGGVKVGTPLSHSHTITLSAATDTVSNYTNTTAGSGDTVEPPYYMLLAIQNTSGVPKLPPVGLIGMWLGTDATIPAGWFKCDGSHGTPNLTDKFIKIVNTSGDLGSAAGSETHTHTGVSHTHTATGTHTHTGSSGGPSATRGADSGGDGYGISTHTHPLSSVGTATATYANTTLDSGSAVDNQPPYRTVTYIQFQFGSGGAALFAIL